MEYIKRACIEHNLYYLKIHKDGSCSLRYAIDLNVLKSTASRLCFEAKPTCNDGLYQDRPSSLIWNIGSKETLDLSKVYYEHLPDWKPVYEQLKIKMEQRFGRSAMKERYIADAKLRKRQSGESLRDFGQAIEDLL